MKRRRIVTLNTVHLWGLPRPPLQSAETAHILALALLLNDFRQQRSKRLALHARLNSPLFHHPPGKQSGDGSHVLGVTLDLSEFVPVFNLAEGFFPALGNDPFDVDLGRAREVGEGSALVCLLWWGASLHEGGSQGLEDPGALDLLEAIPVETLDEALGRRRVNVLGLEVGSNRGIECLTSLAGIEHLGVENHVFEVSSWLEDAVALLNHEVHLFEELARGKGGVLGRSDVGEKIAGRDEVKVVLGKGKLPHLGNNDVAVILGALGSSGLELFALGRGGVLCDSVDFGLGIVVSAVPSPTSYFR